mmetsp:Transcript_107819/g.207277  ORF Transcript_107819/g.207277 Transcript_107819/m.207277 type:complete len:432 (+) Transcript_107819:66-1361(+)
MPVKQILVILSSATLPVGLHAIAELPPMGWNSWYALGKARGWPSTNESTVEETARLLVQLGLRSAGYHYLIIDDSWENTKREPDGRLLANPSKFPSGMAAVGSRVRSLGLKLGLYTTPGNFTCSGQQGGGEPGSLGHVEQDVNLWVKEWGIEYLKDCVCNTTEELRKHAYTDMKRALTATGRPVMYECDPFMDQPWRTLNSVCNLWAVSDDIGDSYDAWTRQVDKSYAADVTKYAKPGSWNLFDYLQIGNGGQSFEEYKSQFFMYAILAAPLIIGTDLRSISRQALQLYLSPEVIAVNQDELGIPGVRLWQDASTGMEAWARRLKAQSGAEATCALLLFNRGDVARQVTVSWAQLAVLGAQWADMKVGVVRDVFMQADVGKFSEAVAAHLQPHSSALFRVQKAREKLSVNGAAIDTLEIGSSDEKHVAWVV